MTVRKLIEELQDLGEDKLDLEVFYDTERGWDWVTDVRVTTRSEWYGAKDTIVGLL